MAKSKVEYEVNHPHHSQGPRFTSLTEAFAYIRHCLTDGGEASMTLTRIGEKSNG